MLKKLFGSVREYKKPTFITLFFIVLEAIIETLIPFITANLVNSIKEGSQVIDIVSTGLLLALMACLSLACGGIAGFTCSKASAGFAKNLRNDMYDKIQSFSFAVF